MVMARGNLLEQETTHLSYKMANHRFITIRSMKDEYLYSEYLFLLNNPLYENTGLNAGRWLPVFKYEIELRGL